MTVEKANDIERMLSAVEVSSIIGATQRGTIPFDSFLRRHGGISLLVEVCPPGKVFRCAVKYQRIDNAHFYTPRLSQRAAMVLDSVISIRMTFPVLVSPHGFGNFTQSPSRSPARTIFPL